MPRPCSALCTPRDKLAQLSSWSLLPVAVQQGNSLALEGLGWALFAKVEGVPQDYVKAYMWFTLLAEKGGEKFGVDIRDTLAKSMTPEQLAEAQQLAREWKLKEQ